MHSPGINGEGELRGQPANPGSPGKMAVKTECVCAHQEYLKMYTNKNISNNKHKLKCMKRTSWALRNSSDLSAPQLSIIN